MVRLNLPIRLNNAAALWKRAVAYFIDVLVVNLIIVLPFRKLLEFPSGSFSEVYSYLSSYPEITYSLFFVLLSVSLLMVLYWAVFEYKLSQTIGKMAMNISVKSVSGKMSFRSAFVRSISKMSSFLLFLDFLYLVYKKSNQRYLEVLSNTEVVDGVSLK